MVFYFNDGRKEAFFVAANMNNDSRSELISALKESMNIEDEKHRSAVKYVSETQSIVINGDRERLSTAEEDLDKKKKQEEERLSMNKMTEEELFQKLLKQKRS